MKISLSEIEKKEGMNIDPVGFLFTYQDRLYRAINNSHEQEILYLFESGAINELNEAGLIPHTSISEIELDDHDLVIEHYKIDTVTFSVEWSFEMMKEAALTVIKVNRILFKFGFETKDAHNHNIVFDGNKPKFVDIGSFQRRKNNKYWECKDEFYRIFIYPLKMWASGNTQLARKSISDVNGYLNRYEYTLYKNPLLRFLPINYIKSISYYLEVLRNLSKFDLDNIFIVKRPELKRKILKSLRQISLIGLLPHNNINLNRLENKVLHIQRPQFKTKWGEYHANIDKNENFNEGGRFDLILKLLKQYKIDEVFEIGGNQGLLSIEIKKFAEKVICSDYDEIAVDHMFLNIKKMNVNITPVLLDILHPIYLSLNFDKKLKPQFRFKSQAVLALAISHHLILGQKVPIDLMFRTFIQFTREYLFVEFMPNGVDKSPNPDWYNLDWFRSHFIQYFDLILERPSTEDRNRILFFGKLKAGNSDTDE